MDEFMDAASGVFGETAFRQLLTREASRATRYQDFFSLCLVKPDEPAGDEGGGEQIQQAVSRKIAQFLRATDVVGQISDGIAILLLNTPDAEAAHIAERIRSHIETVAFHADPNGPPRRVTVSIGLASFPRDGSSEGGLLGRAQTHLKEASRRGGNRVVSSGDDLLGVRS